jgi:hypothetical protein
MYFATNLPYINMALIDDRGVFLTRDFQSGSLVERRNGERERERDDKC